MYSDKWYALTPIALWCSVFSLCVFLLFETTIFVCGHRRRQRHTQHGISFLCTWKKKNQISCKWTHLWSCMENKYVGWVRSIQFVPWFCYVGLCARTCERFECRAHILTHSHKSMGKKDIVVCFVCAFFLLLLLVAAVAVFFILFHLHFQFATTLLRGEKVFQTPYWAIHFTWNSKTLLPKDARIKSH